MADSQAASIGAMRWQIILATRNQTPDPFTGITEAFINPIQVYAEIRPIGLQTYIGSEQIDTPITHRIIMRWQDGLDMFDVALREIERPDGTRRQEIFRIRRVGEWQGRQRFSVLDVELEKRDG
jgi:head-tail adaptor